MLETLNTYRTYLFEELNYFPNTTSNKIHSWCAHKLFSLITLTGNAICFFGSLATLALTISTIGIAKIAVYTLTCGNYKLPLSTYFWELGSMATYAVVETIKTIYQVVHGLRNLFLPAIIPLNRLLNN